MRRRTLHQSVRLGLALFVLFFALVAKVPNPHCKCHDSKPAKQQYCPFGELRALASSFLAASVILIPAPLPPEFKETSYRLSLTVYWTPSPFEARAPPLRAPRPSAQTILSPF